MSWRHNCKTSCKHVLKTSWRRFRKTYCKYVLKTSWKTKSITLKTSSRRLEDVLENKTCLLGTAENGNVEYLIWRIQSKALLHYFSHFFAKEPRKCWFFLFNPFMRNVEKWPNILLKSCTVSTSRFLKCVWPFYQHCVKSACILSFPGPHAGKCGSKKLRIWTLFTQCNVIPERINPIDNLIRTFQNF